MPHSHSHHSDCFLSVSPHPPVCLPLFLHFSTVGETISTVSEYCVLSNGLSWQLHLLASEEARLQLARIKHMHRYCCGLARGLQSAPDELPLVLSPILEVKPKLKKINVPPFQPPRPPLR